MRNFICGNLLKKAPQKRYVFAALFSNFTNNSANNFINYLNFYLIFSTLHSSGLHMPQNFTVKVEPSPSLLFTEMLQPSRWQIFFTIASPRPKPPFLPLCDLSTVKNLLNTLLKFYSEMPMPVSDTSKWSISSVTVTLPPTLL